MILRDKSHAEFEKEIARITKTIERNYEIGHFDTLVWWYYAGHGSLRSKTAIVCNKGPAEEEFFPIEEQLLRLSLTNGSYIVAVLDCCRTVANRDERNMMESSPIIPPTTKCIFTYGSDRGDGVRTDSVVAQQVIECYNTLCRPTDDRDLIVMPTFEYITCRFGDNGFCKAPSAETIILNAVACNNSKVLNLKILGKKFQFTPSILETTKAYMDDDDMRGFVDMLAERWAKPRKQMLELIDRANKKRMIQLQQ